MLTNGLKSIEEKRKHAKFRRPSSELTFEYSDLEAWTSGLAKCWVFKEVTEIKLDFITQHLDYLVNQAVPYKNKTVFDNFLTNLLPMIKAGEIKILKHKINDLRKKSYSLDIVQIDDHTKQFFRN